MKRNTGSLHAAPPRLSTRAGGAVVPHLQPPQPPRSARTGPPHELLAQVKGAVVRLAVEGVPLDECGVARQRAQDGVEAVTLHEDAERQRGVVDVDEGSADGAVVEYLQQVHPVRHRVIRVEEGARGVVGRHDHDCEGGDAAEDGGQCLAAPLRVWQLVALQHRC